MIIELAVWRFGGQILQNGGHYVMDPPAIVLILPFVHSSLGGGLLHFPDAGDSGRDVSNSAYWIGHFCISLACRISDLGTGSDATGAPRRPISPTVSASQQSMPAGTSQPPRRDSMPISPHQVTRQDSSLGQASPDPTSIDPMDSSVHPQSQNLNAGPHATIKPDNSGVNVSAASINSGNSASPNQPPTPPPPPPPPQLPAASKAPSAKRGVFAILRHWIFELLACVFAVLMVAVEIVLLAVYNNRSTGWWNHTWQINSVFAFLTALLEAAIAYAVSACLGQLTWFWFQHGNQELRWMDKLTNAKGARGALTFITSKNAWKHWAALGAALIVALLGTSVFAQEIIVQKDGASVQDPSSGTTYVPISNNYFDNLQTGDKDGDELPLVQMMASITSGFAAPASFNNPDNIIDLVTCAAGNCTFAEYSSLAVCYKCADISNSVVVPCDTGDCTMSLPDNTLTLDAVNGYFDMTAGTLYPNASYIADVGPLIAHWKAMGSSDFPSPPYALECAV
jgi:hypothetical protein